MFSAGNAYVCIFELLKVGTCVRNSKNLSVGTFNFNCIFQEILTHSHLYKKNSLICNVNNKRQECFIIIVPRNSIHDKSNKDLSGLLIHRMFTSHSDL